MALAFKRPSNLGVTRMVIINTSICVLKMAEGHFKFHAKGISFFQILLFPWQKSLGTHTSIIYVLLNLTFSFLNCFQLQESMKL